MSSPRTRGKESRRSERGQMLLIFALMIVPISFAVGAIAVDASLWQSERRGAQKDADLAATAGAQLLLPPWDSNTKSNAETEALAYIIKNDEEGNTDTVTAGTDRSAPNTVVVDRSCFVYGDTAGAPPADSVSVNLDKKSRAFFSEFFGLDIAPDIGAHARACMGSPVEGEGIFPLGVQVSGFDSECFQPDPNDPGGPEIPIFGQYCRLAFAGADLTSGEGGWLRLYDDGGDACSANSTGGGNELQDEIEDGGAQTTCYVAPPGTTPDDCDGPPPPGWYTPYVNYCVWPKTQTFNNPTQDAFENLFADCTAGQDSTIEEPCEGECDRLFGSDPGTTDDFMETVEALNGQPNPPPGSTTFARRDCTSPRLVDLVILESFEANGNDPKPILAFASFYIEACEIDGVQYRDCNPSGGQLGQASLYGFFINILQQGRIGAFNKYGQATVAMTE